MHFILNKKIFFKQNTFYGENNLTNMAFNLDILVLNINRIIIELYVCCL